MLLLGLLLLTAACKKDAGTPKPTLEGRWIEHSHKVYSCDKYGNIFDERSYAPPAPTYGMIIHPTAYERIAPQPDGTWTTSSSELITRTGDVIQFHRKPGTELNLRIMKLTNDTLTLRNERVGVHPKTGDYEVRDDTFSR